MTARDDAVQILRAAIDAGDARRAVVRALRLDGGVLEIGGSERIELGSVAAIHLAGAGKAAVGMALGARDVLGARIAGGTITTVDGVDAGVPGIDVWQAAHPVPDTRGLAGASEALRCAREAGPRDLVLCLLSGGASALWPCPPPGVSLSAVQAATAALLRAGAAIAEVNAVRKHLSRIAGGWLAREAWPARVVTLAISDVVGSPPDVIGSGPTVADPTTFADALEVIARYEVSVPSSVLHRLQAGAAGHAPETPRPGDLALDRASFHVVASVGDALAGARARAQALGYRAEVVADDMEGEARDVARQIADLALSRRREMSAGDAALALLLGGESTVTVRGDGRGGRNQEMALALAIELDGRDGILAASMGTDGADGPTDAAGGIVDGETLSRAADAGLDARESLDRNDSNPFLRATDALLVTGPTGTNVGDVVLVLIQPAGD